MRRWILAAALAFVAASPAVPVPGARAQGVVGSSPAAAAAAAPGTTRVEACLRAAGQAHRVDPALLVVLLQVEGGSLGRTSRNSNGTEDIGPMQVNTIWVARIASRWGTTPEAAFLALRDNFCANVEAGAWILRLGMDDSGGDFWRGVGFYHSRTPEHRERYLRLVADRAVRLMDRARRDDAVRGGAATPARAAPGGR